MFNGSPINSRFNFLSQSPSIQKRKIHENPRNFVHIGPVDHILQEFLHALCLFLGRFAGVQRIFRCLLLFQQVFLERERWCQNTMWGPQDMFVGLDSPQ